MGGRVALEIARIAPQRVKRLALLDTGYEPLAAGQAGAQEREKRMKLLQHAKAHGMREMGKLWAPGMVHPDCLNLPLFNEILDMIERRTPEQFEAQINALLGRPDAGPVLRKLQCPTTLICGLEDAWSPYSRHEAMSHMVPSQWVTLHAVAHCGHMSTMEQPDAVSALLDTWLSRG
jgi:pimeloyl-ACP methyl ester carboxylesterase